MVEDKCDTVRIECELVHLNDYNANEMRLEIFESVKEDIEENGFNKPINVRPDPEKEGHYLVIDGEHRYRAWLELTGGKLPVPCIIDSDPDEIRARMNTIAWNNKRGSLNPVKLARNLVVLSKVHDRETLAKKLGYKPSQIDRFFGHLGLPKDLEEAVVAHKSAVSATEADLPKPSLTYIGFTLTAEQKDRLEKAFLSMGEIDKSAALMVLVDSYLESIEGEEDGEIFEGE